MAFVLIAKVSIYFTNVLVKKHTHTKNSYQSGQFTPKNLNYQREINKYWG